MRVSSGIFLVLFLLGTSGLSQRSNVQFSTGAGVQNTHALANFFAALSQAEQQDCLEPVRIMHFGDSHVAADILTREIRARFQNDFGDGGPGFIVPRNPMATRRSGVVSGATDGWVVEGIGGRVSADNIYGPAGINLATSSPGERAWLETSCNHFEVYFVRQPGGGRIDIAIDGASVLDAPITLLAQVPKLDRLSFDLPDDAVHRIELRTLCPGRVRLLGIVAEHIARGVTYDVFGINGARANRILSWSAAALASAIRFRAPDLIIIAYGTNELADSAWTPAAYEALIGNIIERFHAIVPKASILVFAPPDRADLPLGNRLRLLTDAERHAAIKNNAAFWSALDGMGGIGSMNKWVRLGLAQSDHVHLTSSGYALLGDHFYSDLMRGRSSSLW